jgi:hypothetical protein
MTAAAWGSVYGLAVATLAAHKLTLAADDGGASASTAGALTSKGAGDLSEGYGAPSGGVVSQADALLYSTKYGREFARLRNSRVARAPRVVLVG